MTNQPDNRKIKIVIADDLRLFADLLEKVVNNEERFEVIGRVQNGKQLMQLLNNLVPDIILLDINMPFLNGMEAALEIRRKNALIKIIFVSMYCNPSILHFCISNKINGYISKATGVGDLTDCIIKVMEGEFIHIKDDEPVHENTDFTDHFHLKLKLARREIEVIRHIKNGLATKQIADAMELSTYTVETHRKNIFRKLSITNMAELVRFAIENNI